MNTPSGWVPSRMTSWHGTSTGSATRCSFGWRWTPVTGIPTDSNGSTLTKSNLHTDLGTDAMTTMLSCRIRARRVRPLPARRSRDGDGEPAQARPARSSAFQHRQTQRALMLDMRVNQESRHEGFVMSWLVRSPRCEGRHTGGFRVPWGPAGWRRDPTSGTCRGNPQGRQRGSPDSGLRIRRTSTETKGRSHQDSQFVPRLSSHFSGW